MIPTTIAINSLMPTEPHWYCLFNLFNYQGNALNTKQLNDVNCWFGCCCALCAFVAFQLNICSLFDFYTNGCICSCVFTTWTQKDTNLSLCLSRVHICLYFTHVFSCWRLIYFSLLKKTCSNFIHVFYYL